MAAALDGEQDKHTDITAMAVALPHMRTVILSDQWLAALNHLQRMRNQKCMYALVHLPTLEVGAVIAMEVSRESRS